jgi:hypothetical protein
MSHPQNSNPEQLAYHTILIQDSIWIEQGLQGRTTTYTFFFIQIILIVGPYN